MVLAHVTVVVASMGASLATGTGSRVVVAASVRTLLSKLPVSTVSGLSADSRCGKH